MPVITLTKINAEVIINEDGVFAGVFSSSGKVSTNRNEIKIYDDLDSFEFEFEDLDGANCSPPIVSATISATVNELIANYFSLLVGASTIDYNQLLAEGSFSDRVLFTKFGAISDVDTADPPVSIWFGRTIYTGFPDVAEELEILSSSANDTAGGTGAQTVLIQNLLDADYNLLPDVEVTLNGLTPVPINIGQTYLRCNRARVTLSGSNQANVGSLTIRHRTTTANIFAVMPPNSGQTQILQYTVPANKTFFISTTLVGINRASGALGSATIDVQSRDFGTNTFRTFLPFKIQTGAPIAFNAIFKLDEKTDLRTLVSDVSDNGTNVFGEIQGTLKDN